MNRNWLFAFPLVFAFVSCSLRAPNITFTQTQTAAERQMIGEDREIERDGWLISSIKSSATGAEIWETGGDSDSKDEDWNYAQKTLKYLAPEVKQLKLKGVLAESLDGKLVKNPNPSVSVPKDVEERIPELLKLVNQSRTVVFEKKIAELEKNPPSNPTEGIAGKTYIRQTFYRLTESGEFWETSPGKWQRRD